MTAHVRLDVEDCIGSIVLNRPEAKNAVSEEMVESLIALTLQVEQDDAIRCVVIRGEGETFQAGADVKGFSKALREDASGYKARMERRIATGHLIFHRLRRMQKPVLASVQGVAAGLGVSIIAISDLAIASEDASIMLAYRHMGLSVDGGVSYALPRIIGERRALELALLGGQLTAAQALDWGLFNWVVPRAELEAETMRIARRLASGPTRALGRAKQLFRNSLDSSWDQQSAREAEGVAYTAATRDHAEGVEAFIGRRAPRFTGQ